ncbi:uncharacterized protein TRIADDRAFT_19619 [Trichoplax adhaerens]|uniref:Multidrug resistance-associated protein 4 n=1 Tax=Trichoplax adhaerens TaxID=10228 RepID=B3RLS7_TRIAD|nr:hypothetical protein TRIADDRAFT_19619 [Trichoplax adhaerens]EDV28837.1 hypothetical protein TRIADDRAFT_19619 [Trichoplax adhaerens]|eukprot:XP_002108039.1 hypothetical protein TRIADDRAFT_19619 [Trichoplax adhaerens]
MDYFYFRWLNTLFRTGNKRCLEKSDLYNLYEEDKAEASVNKFEKEWAKESKKASKIYTPSLQLAIVKAFGFSFMLLGIPCFLEESIKIAQPLLIGQIVNYFTTDTTVTTTEVYFYALGLSLSVFLTTVLDQIYYYAVERFGMRIRVTLCSVIFKKVLKLSTVVMSNVSTGHILNLMANDAQRFDEIPTTLHYIWIGPIQVIVLTILLWREIGIACLSGLAVILLLLPVQILMAKFAVRFRRYYLENADARIRVMSEIISGMKAIKMYAWEESFSESIESSRKFELSGAKNAAYMATVNTGLFLISSTLIAFTTFMTQVLLGKRLLPSMVFTVFSLLTALQLPILYGIPKSLQSLFEARISLKTVEAFLNLKDSVNKAIKHDETVEDSEDSFVTIDHVSAAWDGDPLFEDLSLSIESNKLYAIVGPVGCGKTSLLMTLLGEMTILRGSINMRGKVAYVPQQPWILPGTIRDNILFDKPMRQERYNRILRVCALNKDIEKLPFKDDTRIGERGIQLSGGQKARICLARALYMDADIYLLDDPFSAVDIRVGRHIYQQCIINYLQDRLRILVTHQLQFLRKAHQIVILKDGRIAAIGTYSELAKSGIDFTSLMTEEIESKQARICKKVQQRVDRNLSLCKNKVNRHPSMYVTIFDAAEIGADVDEDIIEDRQTGGVALHVYKAYFTASSPLILHLFLIILCAISQGCAITADWWLSQWCNSFVVVANSSVASDNSSATSFVNNAFNSSVELDQVLLYGLSNRLVIIIYGALVFITVSLCLLRSTTIAKVAVNASRNLHSLMFKSVMKAPIHFLASNPSGIILNRFSKEIGRIDDLMPITLSYVVQYSMFSLGAVVASSIVNPWVLVLILPMGLLFFFMRKYYLNSSRALKRLEATATSPVYSHISTTLQGLAIIRNFGMEKEFIDQFFHFQNDHTQAWFFFMIATRWIAFHLDLICSLFIAGVTFGAIWAKDASDAGLVGLSLSYSISLLGNFQWSIRQSAELENQACKERMTSVERIVSYTNLAEDGRWYTDNDPLPNWPKNGKIQFDNVTYAYDSSLPPVLHDLSCTIQPREKIGVVGRTGAGKSTLLCVLFRLSNYYGDLEIDGVEISRIGLQALRSKLSIIPQEPFLFTGTLRSNIDPFSVHDDDLIWEAIDNAQLRDVVEELPEKLGFKITEAGANFSIGQKQLICLARALLRNNKILLVDEATANLDPQTDAIIQKSIRKHFKDCTVITIAHRLNTIIDSDRILVLDAGQLIQFDSPHELLSREDGLFHQMAKQAGSSELAKLKEIAKKKYDENMATLAVMRYRSNTECRSNDSTTEIKDIEYIQIGERTYSISITYADSDDNDKNLDPYVPILPDEVSISLNSFAIESDNETNLNKHSDYENRQVAPNKISQSNSQVAASEISRSNSGSSTGSSGKWV